MFAPRNVGKKKVQMSLKPIKSKSKAAPNVLAPKCSIEEEEEEEEEESSATASTTGTGAVEPASKKRKSRWGSATATSADSVESDTGLFSNLGATTTFVPKAAKTTTNTAPTNGDCATHTVDPSRNGHTAPTPGAAGRSLTASSRPWADSVPVCRFGRDTAIESASGAI